MGKGEEESLPLKEGGAQRRKIEWLVEPQITKIVAKRHLLAMHYALCTNYSKGEIIMNKIFKVVYSKARHMKVVVSEIAKTHSNSEAHSEWNRIALFKLAFSTFIVSGVLFPHLAMASLTTMFVGGNTTLTFMGYKTGSFGYSYGETDGYVSSGTSYVNDNVYLAYDKDLGKYVAVVLGYDDNLTAVHLSDKKMYQMLLDGPMITQRASMKII